MILTVMLPGLSSHWRWSWYFPPPTLVRVNMHSPEVWWTLRIALGLVLVALISRTRRLQRAVVNPVWLVVGDPPPGYVAEVSPVPSKVGPRRYVRN
ncbi:hypothetical protein [Actinomadura alba]|uniref:Uncharacterized protein n=1 Tax=Actinomadura alba TaxID=406431 RepID=A0ABR7LV45_9ACTN|nr:hypothetical protein [Actinomadura alba]MBC6468641.1 hypothetical protein [Actinomadura alba]